jgi:hypothetical protein
MGRKRRRPAPPYAEFERFLDAVFERGAAAGYVDLPDYHGYIQSLIGGWDRFVTARGRIFAAQRAFPDCQLCRGTGLVAQGTIDGGRVEQFCRDCVARWATGDRPAAVVPPPC